jgi:gliding motility-associated-like protein
MFNSMKFYSLLLLLCIGLKVQGQVPIIQWQRTIGGSGDDRLIMARQTPDRGYILIGTSESGISGEKTEAGRGLADVWIVKMDELGNIQWQKTYGGAHNDYAPAIIMTRDGGYAVLSYSQSNNTGDRTSANRAGITGVGSAQIGNDIWFLKLDANGVLQWQQTYGSNQADAAFTLIQLPDDGYIMCGYTAGSGGERTTPSYGYNDHWMIRTDAGGNILWQKSNGGSFHDALYGMIAVPGGYVGGGYSCSGPGGTKTTPFLGAGGAGNGTANRDNWVIRTDTAGNIIWQQEVAGQSGFEFQAGNRAAHRSAEYGVSMNSAGEYVIGNTSSSGANGNKTTTNRGTMDFWIVGLDSSNGNILWQHSFGGNLDDELGAVFQTTDGGYFLAGLSNSGISGEKADNSRGGADYWVIKTDPTWAIQWQMTIGGSSGDTLCNAIPTIDGGFLLSGWSNSPVSGEKTEASRGGVDWWIVKLGPCDTTPTRIADQICIGHDYRLPGGSIVSQSGVYHDTLRNHWNTCDSVVITTLTYYNDSIHLMNGQLLGSDTAVCSGQIVRLDAGYPGATYSWSTGATTASIDVSVTGDYSVEIESPNGCNARDTVQVIVYPVPEVDLGQDTGVCDRDLPFVLSVQPGPGENYRWSNGLTSSSIDVNISGLYWLEVERYGCTGRDSIEVTVVKTPVFSIGNDSIICEQFPLRIGTEMPDATYQWSTGAATPFIEVNSTDTYILEVNLSGCRVYDTVHITAMPVPDIDLGDDDDICPEETIVLDATYQPGSRYRWDTGDTTATYAATGAGTYRVEVVSVHGCIGHGEITLSYYPKPIVSLGEDTVVCEETPLRLSVWGINADSIRWSDGSAGNILDIRYGGEYIATGINKCGTGSDTILVKQIFCDIWLPNGFTPNADGVNDVFRILGNTGRLEGVTLSIYNRWGERIFITQDKYKGWDGYHKGMPAQTGTYVYLLEYNLDGNPYKQTGNFHLLR